MKYYPIALDLNSKKATIIGGGKVAERKARTLLKAGARVKIVAPGITVNLEELKKRKRIVVKKRKARISDVSGSKIVVAATNDPLFNRKVLRWSRKAGAWINAVDNIKNCDFIMPAIARKSKAIIAIYTDGKDPILSRDLKNFLKDNWNDFLSYRNKL